jgi:hypothetical protein
MAGCDCSADSCKCIDLENRVQELEEEVETYKIALHRLSSFQGRKLGLYYGRDGLQDIRSIARDALSPSQ